MEKILLTTEEVVNEIKNDDQKIYVIDSSDMRFYIMGHNIINQNQTIIFFINEYYNKDCSIFTYCKEIIYFDYPVWEISNISKKYIQEKLRKYTYENQDENE